MEKELYVFPSYCFLLFLALPRSLVPLFMDYYLFHHLFFIYLNFLNFFYFMLFRYWFLTFLKLSFSKEPIDSQNIRTYILLFNILALDFLIFGIGMVLLRL
jgi:hypothetical protein